MPKPVSFPFPIRANLPVNSAFGKRPLYDDFHSGVDFNSTTGANLNTPVRAAGAGRVVESYNGNSPGQSSWAKLRGTMVRIDHGDGWWTRYHMLVPGSNIPFGTVVRAGDVIGRVGNSGSSGTGAHLHFELWRNGVAINPVGQLTYNPSAFASTSGSGSTPFEDDMTPEQDARLKFVFDAILNGGPDMPDGGRSIGRSLAGITSVVDVLNKNVDQIKTVVTQPVLRVDSEGKEYKVTQIQEIADGKTVSMENRDMLRGLVARPAIDPVVLADALKDALLQADLDVKVDAQAIADATVRAINTSQGEALLEAGK